MSDKQVRVLLVDDHTVLRDGLRALLEAESDITVVSEAETGEQAIEFAARDEPDVVVMDLGLPGLSGLDAIRAIREQTADSRIVVLSMHSGNELVMQAIKAGSDGYVPKSAAHTDLLRAIRTVHSGKRYLDPLAATLVVDKLIKEEKEADLLELLSPREQEVLRGVARGFTSREIGEHLSLSRKTIDTYRQRAMAKLDLSHRSELINFALRAGLLEESK